MVFPLQWGHLGASYTASGSLTAYGAFGLTGAGSSLPAMGVVGMAIATAYAGWELRTAIANLKLSDDRTVSDAIGDFLYDAYAAITN